MNDILTTLTYLAKSNTINFLVMAAILCWIVVKFDLKSMLSKSILKTKNDISDSETKKTNSKALVEQAMETISKLPSEIKEIEDFSKQKTELLKQQIINSTNDTNSKIENNIDKAVKIEEKNISNNITCSVAQNSVETARNNIVEMLKSDPQLHHKFIEDSLNELDKVIL